MVDCTQETTNDPADLALEQELQELAAEFAPTTARERFLVATIVLSERELTKLGRISRVTATPCDSPAFSRAFNTARNGRDQAGRALDRLRDRAELARAAAKGRKKKAEEDEDEDESDDEAWPEFNRWGERNIRDTGLSVPEIACVMEDGHSDAYILAEFRSLRPEDLEFCRAEMAKAKPASPGPSSPLPTALILLLGLALGLLMGRGGAPSPTAPAGHAEVVRLGWTGAHETNPPTPERGMSDRSTIEWTDATWNPLRGCTKVSPGCAHCYAETFAERFRGVPGHPYEQGFDLRRVPAKLAEPLRWSRPRMVFVNSMSDLFHKDVPDAYIRSVVRVMQFADWHTYQVLTKRSERLRDLLATTLRDAAALPHIWWGVSVEDRRHGLPRVAHLRTAPARMRFLSIEPLLEDLGPLDLDGIAWAIVGGESGPGARPLDPSWVRALRDLCRAASVPFFFKQWGGVRKGLHGRLLDGRTHDAVPDVSPRPIPDLATRRGMIAEMELMMAEIA